MSEPVASSLTPAQERTLALMRRSEEPVVFADTFVQGLIDEATAAVA